MEGELMKLDARPDGGKISESGGQVTGGMVVPLIFIPFIL